MIDPIALICALTAGTAIAAWRERRNARTIRRLQAELAEAVDLKHEAQQAAKAAYSVGYNDATANTARQWEHEAEMRERRAMDYGYEIGAAERRKASAA